MEGQNKNIESDKIIDIKESIKQLIFLFLLMVALSLVVYYPAKYLKMSSYVTPIAHIIALVITILIIKKSGIKTYIGKFKNVDFSIYLFVILISLSLLIILFPVIQFLPMKENLTGFSSTKDSNIIALMIYGVVFVPVLEELFFRGIILEDFLKVYTVKKAILYSSLVFAVIHLNPPQTFAAFIGGLILGWLYFKTKSLIPCVLLHAVNNFSGGLIFKYFSSHGNFLKGINLLYYLLSFAILISSIYQIRKKKNIHKGGELTN